MGHGIASPLLPDFRAAFAALPDVCLLVDSTLTVTAITPTFLEQTHSESDQSLGHDILDVLHASEAEATLLRDALTQLFATGFPTALPTVRVLDDTLSWHGLGVPILGPEGRPTHSIIRLDQPQQHASIHDLRLPVTLIHCLASKLLGEVAAHSPERSDLESLARHAQELADTLERLGARPTEAPTSRAIPAPRPNAQYTHADLSELADEVATQRRRAAFLTEISRRLADTLDYDTTVQRIAQLALPSLGDYCAVDVVDARRRVSRLAVAHTCPEHDALLQELQHYDPAWDSPQPSARVLRTGRSELLAVITPNILTSHVIDPHHADIIARLGLHSHMAVPLRVHGRTLGVLSFGLIRPRPPLNEEDLRLAEALAERASFALDGARLYRDAQAALAARDDFLLVAAHELRTPLTSMQLQIHTLRRRAAKALGDHPSAPWVDERLDLLRRGGDRLGQLIDAMLDVASITTGQFKMTLESCDICQSVRTVVAQLEASGELARSKCTVRVEAPGSIRGNWDRLRMEQMLHHLLANALKYGAGFPVEVHLHNGATRTQLIVRDHGIGMAEGAEERIFERFARDISTRNFGGLGVGLYVVRQIVEALGGNITVTSAPNAGATFTVELPLNAASAPQEWPASAPVGEADHIN